MSQRFRSGSKNGSALVFRDSSRAIARATCIRSLDPCLDALLHRTVPFRWLNSRVGKGMEKPRLKKLPTSARPYLVEFLDAFLSRNLWPKDLSQDSRLSTEAVRRMGPQLIVASRKKRCYATPLT
jgi:hypothetical protein